MAEINVRESLKRDLPWALGVAGVCYSILIVSVEGFGYDAQAYWQAIQGEYYVGAPNTRGAFLYSPAFAQLVWPLAQLSWPMFNAVWMLAASLTFAYLLKPLGWRLSIPLWLACTPEIVSGNVFWIFAIVVAFSLRLPVLWAFVLLTKISPGIGLIWFSVRREWKNLFLTVIATTLIVGASFTLEPDAWRAWIDFLGVHLGSTTGQVGGLSLPPVVRIPAAIVLIVWGAMRSKYWTIPAAMVLATPVFGSVALVVFAGLPRLKEAMTKADSVGETSTQG